jgi:hypothetical protein
LFRQGAAAFSPLGKARGCGSVVLLVVFHLLMVILFSLFYFIFVLSLCMLVFGIGDGWYEGEVHGFGVELGAEGWLIPYVISFALILDSLTVFKSVEICRILFFFGIFIGVPLSYGVFVL